MPTHWGFPESILTTKQKEEQATLVSWGELAFDNMTSRITNDISEVLSEKDSRSTEVSQEESKPRFLIAAEHEARRLGKTVTEVLDGDKRRVITSEYPGMNCLDIADVERFASDRFLEPSQELHVLECEFCHSLIDSFSGNWSGVVHNLLEETRAELYRVASEESDSSFVSNKLAMIFGSGSKK